MRQPWLSACIMVTLFPMATVETQHYMSGGICKRTAFGKTGESSLLLLLLPLRLARSLGHDLRKNCGGLRLYCPIQRSCSSASSPLAVPPPSAHSPLAPIYLGESFDAFALPPLLFRGRGESPIFQLVASEGERIESATSLSPPLRNPHKIRGGSSAHTLPLYGRESEGPPGGSFSSGRFLCPHSPPPLFLSSLAAQSRGGIWVGKRREGEKERGIMASGFMPPLPSPH